MPAFSSLSASGEVLLGGAFGRLAAVEAAAAAATFAGAETVGTRTRGAGATGFVTTEKDAVKLSGAMLGRLRSVGPVCVARLDAKFVDQAKVVRELEARLR